MDLSRLTQAQAATLIGIAPRTLRDWSDAPRNDDGTYNWPVLRAYWIAKEYGDGEFSDQRERLAAAQAEKVETENAVRRGELAVVGDVQRVWSDHIAAARSKLLSLPSKLAPQIVGIHEPNVIAAAIRAEITAALTELSEYEPAEAGPEEADGVEGVEPAALSEYEPAEAGPEEADGVEGVEAAADTDGKPVVRRGKKAQ